jgi:hypothetical protein
MPPADPASRTRAIADKARTIAFRHMVEEAEQVVHIERQLSAPGGAAPDEIAHELEMHDCRGAILRMAQHPVSLEKPIGEEEGELGDSSGQQASRHDTAQVPARRGHRERSGSRCPSAPRVIVSPVLWAAALHARGGRTRLRRHARAHPPDQNNTLKLESLPEAQGLKDCGAVARELWFPAGDPPFRRRSPVSAGRVPATRRLGERSLARWASRRAKPAPGGLSEASLESA